MKVINWPESYIPCNVVLLGRDFAEIDVDKQFYVNSARNVFCMGKSIQIQACVYHDTGIVCHMRQELANCQNLKQFDLF